MPRAMRPCPCIGCPAHLGQPCPAVVTTGRCPECTTQAERRRGTARQRGYGHRHETRFRAGVLGMQPYCMCRDPEHGHRVPCLRPATTADHWPLSRRELVARGMDPNDPKHGRALCSSCHSKETASNPNQRGGWNAR